VFAHWTFGASRIRKEARVVIDSQHEIATLLCRLSKKLAETRAKDPSAGSMAATSRLLATQLLLLIALSALPFLPSLKSHFVYDDDVQIVNNTSIQNWESVPSYFTNTQFGSDDRTAASNFHYRPVFFLWLRNNDFLWGRNPVGWHVSALLLHLGVTTSLFFLLRRHFDNSWIATLAALIFGVHPIHIESVVWVSGATDPLAALFLLGSLLLWMRLGGWTNNPSRVGSIACYAAALLSKETAIVFPAIVFVYALAGMQDTGTRENTGDRFANRPVTSALREIFPFLVVTTIYLMARYAVLRGVTPQTHWLSTRDALLTAPFALVFYLRHLLWPFGLSLFYSFPTISSLQNILFWLPLLSLAALAALIYFLWRRMNEPAIPFALAWCFLPLLPVLDIALFQRDDTVHDRYSYLPSIGLAIGVGLLLQYFARSRQQSQPRRAFAVASILAAILGISTVAQSAPWRDNMSLYAHAVERSPKNTIARNNLAAELVKQDRLDEAAPIFQAVLLDRPDYWLANYNFGYLNYRLKRFDMAQDYLRRAIALNDADSDEHAYLGLTYFHEGQFSDAADELRKAIAIKPAGTGYHITLALVLLQLHDLEGARSECLEELAYHPDNSAARGELELLEQEIAKQKSPQR
jgi:protein O-mannosyl-transferase